MIDHELKEQFELVRTEIRALRKGESIWRQFFKGIMSGVGYVTGIVIIIALIGWILNILGILPVFTNLVASLKHAVDTLNSSSALH